MNEERRRLLMGGIGALGAAAGAACPSLSRLKPNSTAANSAVSLGVIGLGRRGSYVTAIMAAHPLARLTAVCDLYPDQIAAARHSSTDERTMVPGVRDARAFRDYRELLASNVDAVLIATPPYQHPEQFEAAVRHRKHIYCEKPVAVSVAGAKRVLAAGSAADSSKTIQFGFQQRFSPEYRSAYAILREGKIGTLQQMTSAWILPAIPQKMPDPLPGEEEKIRHWMFYRETSGCAIVEQDCHGIDAMNWFAGATPLKAVGSGAVRMPLPRCTWTSDHHNITYYYPAGLEGYLVSIKQPLTSQFREVREQFYGSLGVLETTRGYYRWYGGKDAGGMRGSGRANRNGAGQDVADHSLVEAVNSKREISIDAVDAFFRGIVENKPVNLTQAAVDGTLSALLGRMAYETGEAVTWSQLLDSDY